MSSKTIIKQHLECDLTKSMTSKVFKTKEVVKEISKKVTNHPLKTILYLDVIQKHLFQILSSKSIFLFILMDN